ncbi:transposase [Flavobacterium cheongpyeongense]|uniref:transposase n=1 Tax=Flavobacterium cheongpyeongense TaxID=2212651 RepID=UPI003744A95D
MPSKKFTILSGNSIELITNQFHWSPNTIGELYKSRWEVEIFFRDIKRSYFT